MEAISDWVIAFFEGGQSVAGLALLLGSAGLEYVFPPFPGDTITLFGAFLVTAYGWSLIAVFSAVMAGSVAGSMAAYYLGLRLGPPKEERVRLNKIVDGFKRHGAAYLIANRFLPGLRALFFVAAGMAKLPAAKVAFYSALSAALWNALLMAIGAAIGANFDELLGYVRDYTYVVWMVLGAAASAGALIFIVRRRS